MEIEFIGWCHQPTRNHDKVWGVAKHGHQRVTFWGRRGKKLQNKVRALDEYEARKLINSKIAKGYAPVDPEKVDKVYERFGVDLFMVALQAEV